MSVTLSDIETLIRELIDDTLKTDGHDVTTYSTSKTFTVLEDHATVVSNVTVNDVTADFVYSSGTNTFTIDESSSITAFIIGDVVESFYSYYSSYSSTEIQSYIKAALTKLAIKSNKIFTPISSVIYPEPTYRERCLIAAITAILIKPNNESYRLPDMSIQVPRSLPVDDLIDKTIAIFKKDVHGVITII